MGLGSFSGGVSAARFMARRGARVVVTDLATPDRLTESLAAIAGEGVAAVHLGGHREQDFRDAEIVVASPAVRKDNRFLQIARAAGARVTTEMNLFFELCPAPIVGVTGSNGKSTTTAMIHAMLRAAGRSAWLGGNIGRSLLEHVDTIQPTDTIVLELSSFQLEDLGEMGRSPHVAVITTFTPNHLDRHPSMDEYRGAKQEILRHQSPGDFAVLNADDPDVALWPTRCSTQFYGLADHGRDGCFLDGDAVVWRRERSELRFGLLDALRLPGRHNQSNAVGAACAALALGAEAVAVRAALAAFQTLPHRLELVAEFSGRRFIDDSIATTPESTLAALDSLAQPIWLIAGGSDKGLDLGPVARRIAQRVEGVALLGQTGSTLRRLLEESDRAGERLRIQTCDSMDKAVRWCSEMSQAGDVILLSPACASFGMFHNFVDRARAFRRAVDAVRTTRRAAG